MNTVISFEKNSLIINKGEYKKMIGFQTPIEKIEQFNGVIIVMIHPKGISFLNENIFGVSYEGKILWQIKPIKYVDKNSPYTGMTREGDYVKIFNWGGANLVVDPNTGGIISKGYSK